MPQPHFAFRLLNNAAFRWALLLLLVQQMIVASSTYWIAKVAENISVGGAFGVYFVLFILSLTIVYLPASFAAMLLEKAKFTALNRYTALFQKNFNNQAGLRNDRTLKDQRLPFIASEGFLTIDESYRFLFDGVSLLLNVSFNIAVLAWILAPSIMLSYLLGVLLAALAVFAFKQRIYQRGQAAQQGRTKLQRTLSLAWDNVLLGNRYNQHYFNQALQQNQNEALKTAVSNRGWNHLASSLGMLLMMSPVLAWTAILFYQHQNDTALLAVLVATLPRQVLILQYTDILISVATGWSGMKAKLQGLQSAVAVPQNSLNGRIQWDKLQAQAQNCDGEFSLATLPNHALKCGRITLRGANGCGKSSYLCWLKQQLGEQAYYLPAQHELLFADNTALSTGQTLKRNLHELADDLNSDKHAVRMLLLDEWDANLDKDSIDTLNQLIAELSQRCLVIEVRHRA
ncbi:hypothetical protein ACWA5Z_02255 [Testudinibacter sp. P80/BLE/0925]|uniref:hypothetical protein n=1 Tax=Testudinibacter sp. TW-1 TaxID=3417757 RepID=UPI003D364200